MRTDGPRLATSCCNLLRSFHASAISRVLFLLMATYVILLPKYCLAGGVLHVFPPTFNDQTFPVARPIVLSSKTTVTVSETAIEYKIDQTFLNDNEFPVSGLFLLPLAKDETAVGAKVKIDGLATTYTVKSANEFFSTLRELVTAMKDPSLVGLAGKSILEVRPVNIGVRKSVSVSIQYQEPFAVRSDKMELVLPMDGERFSLAPVGEFDVVVRLKTSRAMRNLLSPSHHISVFRETPSRCVVSVRSYDRRVREDFCLVTTFGRDDLEIKLFPHKRPGAKGTFMALLIPPALPPQEKEPEKDIVFVLDTSASMSTSSLASAKRAVILGLSRLSPLDRFNVVIVGTRSSRMTERLALATRENLLRAVEFVNAARRAGGTDLFNSLFEALEQFSGRRRPSMLMLTGDGRATIGITKPDAIIEAVRRNNRLKTRIFTLAFGDKADAALLDKLAVSNRGGSFHLDETQDFQAIVDRFLAGVSPPKASDLKLEFQDVEVAEIDPRPLPDIFGREGLAVFGRYTGAGDVEAKLRLRCKIKGRPKVLNELFKFPAVEKGHAYIPAMWAMRRMARLLEQCQINGPNHELTRKIADLAREFGFKIPASVETEASSVPKDSDKDRGGLLWKFKTSNVVSDVASDLFRRVNDKVFRPQRNRWVDTGYQPSVPTRTVEFLSEDYFSVLRNEPELGACLALGPEITVLNSAGAINVTSGDPARPQR
jgi:Ca-activated chloride channel family protein